MSEVEDWKKAMGTDEVNHVYHNDQEGIAYISIYDQNEGPRKEGTCLYSGSVKECLEYLSEHDGTWELDPPRHVLKACLVSIN